MKIRVFSGVVMIIILFSNIISIINVDAKEQTEFVIQKENVAYNDTKYLADIDTISIKYSMQIEGEKIYCIQHLTIEKAPLVTLKRVLQVYWREYLPKII